MNFSAWSIRNPVAPLLAFFMLMFLGWQSFNSLPITRFPNIDVPLVAVVVTQSGAAPAELETQVAKEVEDAVAGIAGVKEVMTKITDGQSQTLVEFNMDVPTDKAVQDVKDAIDKIRGDLPADVDEPIISRIDVEGQAIMTFAVAAPDMTMEELSWFVDDTITRALQGRPGVGRVDRYGGADREIRIELDQVKLGSWGITAQAVSAQLRATNANIGSGRAELGINEQAIRTLGNASTVETLSQTMIATGDGRHVRLGDLGTISDTYEELRSFVRFNGEPAVTFAVFRAKGASEVSVAETVETALDEIRAAHPNVGIELVDDTVFYTYGNYESALHTLIEGAILAVLVVLAFLKNWRATMIAAVALPLSAVPTFYIMDLLGFSLNLVSFLAITLATGILVDDAIVEIENIARHIRMGKTPYRAAIEAADEIGLAVIATTFTIIAVFVPVSFMPGIPGQYFRQFGMTVAIAVAFSLLVARLITPMMAAYLMSAKDAEGHGDQKDGWAMRNYLRLVSVTSRFRYLTLLGAFIALGISVFFMLQVPGSFMPPEDVSRISISVELPPGSTLDETEAVTDEMFARIRDVEGVDRILIVGGTSPTGDLDLRRASIAVMLEKLDHSLLHKLAQIGNSIPVVRAIVPDLEGEGRKRPQNEIEAEIFAILQDVPDSRVTKLNDRGERDISFSILSDNEEDLNLAVARLEAALSGDPLLANVASEGALPRPELHIKPRLDEAARLGVTTAAIADVLRVATIGDYDGALAKLTIDNRQIPVRVRLNDETRADMARIGVLRVPTINGGSVPLNSVVTVTISQGPSMIERLNRERKATIGANLPVGVALDTSTNRFNEIVAGVDLPDSIRIAKSGDA
ncbi:MAG: efflux RND transporter permease subunit, partial [Gemmobacter sp.]